MTQAAVRRGAQALVATAARVVPGLDGRVAPAVETRLPWHACGDEALASVRRLLATRHPEAGPHYAALRGWGLLVWQPIYLAVIAAHLHDEQPDLEGLSLAVDAGEVGGYVLGERALDADQASRQGRAAAQLVAGIGRLLPGWRRHAPLHPKAAWRTCADCAMAALLAVGKHRPDWSAADVLGHASRWLDELGLGGESGIVVRPAAGGETVLEVDRKVCCLHFRRLDGEPCSTCPRLAARQRDLNQSRDGCFIS